MKKISVTAIAILVAGLSFGAPGAYAAGKRVDCSAVMNLLDSGKKPKEVAAELKISTSSVYRCRRAAAKAKMGSQGGAPSPAAPSPMATH
jgi:hypothetical protein